MIRKLETTPQRSRIMQKIRSVDTEPECIIRKLLWSRGIRYRKHHTKLPGKPDIVIARYKLAIFIDGEFWHGFNWENKKQKIKTNRDYWIPKIERNMERDRNYQILLESDGWTVLRLWETEIKKKPMECLERVLALISPKGSDNESI